MEPVTLWNKQLIVEVTSSKEPKETKVYRTFEQLAAGNY